ncbi:hypothetical protein FZEAL_266 [Fusarium zealandicum]|uniref:Cation efflux protein transmembrane domain-containing protein n=1 Tax=Fusarium zealandicum TaxID=1053134 RepID=A0A8H4UVK3_9HYPO|nr:hypothetical protein FZEAL_266 [Fusarium zealandicum]
MYETEANQNHPNSASSDFGLRVVQLGLIVDAFLTSLKLAGGWAFDSNSLVADGWHSASDIVTDLVALAVVWASQRLRTQKADDSKAILLEGATSFAASSALAILGLSIAWQNTLALKLQFFPALSGHSSWIDATYSHGQGPNNPNIHAVWVAIITIIVKEWLYRITLKVAKKESSALLTSTAIHHRLDGLLSLVTIASVLLGCFVSGMSWADSFGGLCISVVLMQEAFKNLVTVS